MTSNDGFSVVAPMNVTRPFSTNGRNASCCALLNRCTSSTNNIVCRPDWASVASACAIASRMSLTPDNTADKAMNSALKAFAISLASVVLPTPGGPQRIIECGLPDANATASGLPGPSRCRCPITSATVFGRSLSASGAAGLATGKRSFADDIGALRRNEPERSRIVRRAAFESGERQLRHLAEGVVQFHRPWLVVFQADPDAVEAAFGCFRFRIDVVDSVAGTAVDQS